MLLTPLPRPLSRNPNGFLPLLQGTHGIDHDVFVAIYKLREVRARQLHHVFSVLCALHATDGGNERASGGEFQEIRVK